MSVITIAKPYAKAVFETALASKSQDNWLIFFECVGKVFSNSSLLTFIHSPKLNREAKFDFLISLITKSLKDKLSSQQQNFIQLVINNDRVEVLPEIAVSFRKMVDSSGESRLFTIVSAYKLSSSEETSVLKSLSAKFNCEAKLEIEIQANLIGGIIIKEDDRVIELSISAQLKELDYCLS